MKTIFSFMCAFVALGATAQQFPNLLLQSQDTLYLLSVADTSESSAQYQQLLMSAYSTEVNPQDVGYREANFAQSVTSEFVILSTDDTIFAGGFTITAAHEFENAVIIAASDGFFRLYEKPSLNLIEEFTLGIPEEVQQIYFTFTGPDSIMVVVTEHHLGMLSLSTDAFAFFEGGSPESVWFTQVDVTGLISSNNMPIDNPFTLDTFIYVDPWYVYVDGTMFENRYTRFTSEDYLTSMDDSLGFQTNFFGDLPGYPEIIIDNNDLELASQIGFATHADLVNENTMGTGYIFSINPENGLAELQSIARSLDDNPSSPTGGGYEIHTFGFLDDGRLYRTRMDYPAELLDPTTMEPIGMVHHYGGRQAESTGPNESWMMSNDWYESVSIEGDPYHMAPPSVLDTSGNTIISTVSSLEGFDFDGPGCALEPEQNYPPYVDIVHQNGADAATLDNSWQKIFLVNSNRNPRVDTVINGVVVPIDFGLSFFLYDQQTQEGIFLEDFSRDVNFLVNPRGQHHPKFVASVFQDSLIYMTIWNNNHDNCNDLPGEAVTLKIRYMGGNEFNLEDFAKLPIGSSHGLGSNYIRSIDGTMVGLANTSSYASWSENFNDRHAALYKTDQNMPTEIFGIVQLFKDGLHTYHIDFQEVNLLPNVATDISWSLSSDSSFVTLEVESVPAGTWFWNGSDVLVDSVLTFPVDYILDKESAWFYISGNFPLDTVRQDWSNRVLSVRPLDLKSVLEDALGIGVGIAEVGTLEDQIVLFPNPHHGKFTVMNRSGDPLDEVTIMNVFGQVIHRVTTKKSAVFISLKEQNVSVSRTVNTPQGVVILVY